MPRIDLANVSVIEDTSEYGPDAQTCLLLLWNVEYGAIECVQQYIWWYTSRKLFCNILTSCEPASPVDIYEQFKDDMSDDFLRKRSQALNLSEDEAREVAYNDLLHFLNDELGNSNKSNSDYKLPMPRIDLANLSVIEDTSEYDPDAET